MPNNLISKCLTAVIIVLFSTGKLSAYEINVHENISITAVKKSFSDAVLKSMGYSLGVEEQISLRDSNNKLLDEKTILEWISGGSKTEDSGKSGQDDFLTTRAFNHFHDPLQSWENAFFRNTALTEIYTSSYGRQPVSALVWGLKAGSQDFEQNTTGDWSWSKARQSFYDSFTASAQALRDNHFADCLRAIGHVMHLVQDMSVPAHTRNDTHVLPLTKIPFTSQQLEKPTLGAWHYETYTWNWEKKGIIINNVKEYLEDFLTNLTPVYPDPVVFSPSSNPAPQYETVPPLSGIFDRNIYTNSSPPPSLDNKTVGLAEYTNANFFSLDTIWKYPHPAKAETDYRTAIRHARDGGADTLLHLYRKADTGLTNPISAVRYWADKLYTGDPEIKTDYLDNDVFHGYAKILIPRAVGYSASLIDYFFRGRILIEQPTFILDADGTIIGINGLQVQNVTSLDNGQTIEPFGPITPELPGTLDLVYYYTPTGAGEPVYRVIKDVYAITGENNPINNNGLSIGPIAFGTNEYIPSDIAPENITLLLVFKGKLGAEENAVAAQTFMGKLPPRSRIAYGYQPGGQPNTSNIFTISPDGTNPYQITNASSPNPWYFSPAWSKDGSTMAFEKETCTDPNPSPGDPTCPTQYHLREIVGIDLLSELKYPNNVVYELNYNGDSVANATFSPDGTMIAALKRNEGGWYYYANLVVFDLVNNNKWVVNVDDDPELTSLYGSAPAWSPMGDTIAYYLNRQYNQTTGQMEPEGDLFLIDPFTSVKTRLTNDNFNNTQPSWSPDGEWIVFSSDRDGEQSMDIWMMDKNEGNLTRLVDCTPASCYSPTFSPDGRYVAFGNGSSIYTIQSDGDPSSLQEIAEPGLLTGPLNWSSFLVPPTVDVQLEPSTIIAGGTTILSWQTDRATEVLIQGVTGDQPVDGSIALSPMSTTTYTLTTNGPTGTTVTAITVTVE